MPPDGSYMPVPLVGEGGLWPGMLIAAQLLGLAWWLQRQPAPPRRPRQERPQLPPPFCAWCIYRDGQDCTHPRSPVSPDPIDPV